MVEKETDQKTEPEKDAVRMINFNELYKYNPADLVPEITVSRYSNVAYIQVTQRDVYIDFLELPGIKKDGKMAVNGTRIYMSHVAAARLAEALGTILSQVHAKGGMEQFGANKIKRPQKPVKKP
jgi:hypothetical protein